MATTIAIIQIRHSQQSLELLESLGYPVEWNDYGMGYQRWEELRDISAWLGRVLAVSLA